jgi:Nucleotidyl transferase AbiEii toxin, Type IV TA system
LSGAHLRHRLSRDIDLFCHSAQEVRLLAGELPAIAAERGVGIDLVRDSGTMVRAAVRTRNEKFDLDIVHEAVPDIGEPERSAEGIVLESLPDLRAAKVTCILSRSEPRDLVDLLFLDRSGFPPEKDLALALRKDGGIDPGILGWLLSAFPVAPLPTMLVPLTEAELRAFRDDLGGRFRQLAAPGVG